MLVQRNTFQLSGSDATWLDSNAHRSDRAFIRGLLKRRFDDAHRRFRTDRDLAVACRAFLQCSEYPFRTNGVDSKRLDAFLRITPDEPKSVMRSFRLLHRGYDDDDLPRSAMFIAKTLQSERAQVLSAIQSALRLNASRLATARKGKRHGVARLYERNGAHLRSIRVDAEQIYSRPDILAVLRLHALVDQRRSRSSGHGIDSDADYAFIKSRTHRCDPRHIPFPLRMLRHIANIAYDGFFQMWKRGVSRDALLLELGRDEDFGVLFDWCLGDVTRLDNFLGTERTRAVVEMKKTWAAECFLSTALVGATTTEGMLWDFATYLNRHSVPVFKQARSTGKIHLYLWDSKRNDYVKRKRNGRPAFELRSRQLSIRDLLRHTRLGWFVDEQLYSYLVDEYYWDRNRLAHGRASPSQSRIDAISALVALQCCAGQLVTIKDDLEARRITRRLTHPSAA